MVGVRMPSLIGAGVVAVLFACGGCSSDGERDEPAPTPTIPTCDEQVAFALTEFANGRISAEQAWSVLAPRAQPAMGDMLGMMDTFEVRTKVANGDASVVMGPSSWAGMCADGS